MKEKRTLKIRHSVMWPTFLCICAAGIYGLCSGEKLAGVFGTIFDRSMDGLTWLYQLAVTAAFVLVALLTFSRTGRIRIGGKEAKPQYGFFRWFAISLTSGIATGIITYGVSQPVIYFDSIYGELDALSIAPGSAEAATFALARVMHEWTFVPYAVFSLCGILVAYMCYNRKQPLSVASSLTPLFGEKRMRGRASIVIDCLSVMALVLGLAGSLGSGILLIASGLNVTYGIPKSAILLSAIAVFFVVLYMFAAIKGIDKGVQLLATTNTWLFYFFMALLFLLGPTLYILSQTVTSVGYWMQHLALWCFDTGLLSGEALVKWWTITNWAFYVAFAPVTGVFLAQLSYGRTVREFMITNWITPSIFSIAWFGIWGGTAMRWQATGVLDIASVIRDGGALSAIWAFIGKLPLAQVLVPLVMLMLVLSFCTAADSNVMTIASLCTKNAVIGRDASNLVKLAWGLLCALLAWLLLVFVKDESGLSGIKYLGSVGGMFLLAVVILQIISAAKLFFRDIPREEQEEN